MHKSFSTVGATMGKNYEARSKTEIMLDAVAALLPQIKNEAAYFDETAQFPHTSWKRLEEIGLLKATIPVSLGGSGFGYGSAGAAALLRLFVLLGEGSLPIARLYEAHVNALQLIFRYGSKKLMACCAEDVADNHIFALWVTDAQGEQLSLETHSDGFVLHGCKAFCSGAGVATRALITAGTSTGTQMLVTELERDTRVLSSKIKLAGMRAAITGSVDFSGMLIKPDALLGRDGDYLREPVFSAGAWRSAAAALGGLQTLVSIHRDELLKRGRDDDPHQRARFGQVVMAFETARLWMTEAAQRGCLEDTSDEAVVAYINLARLAVETACLDAIRHTQRSLGLAAFMAGHPAERLCRDLTTYLRQPAPDDTLDKAAQFYFHSNLPGE